MLSFNTIQSGYSNIIILLLIWFSLAAWLDAPQWIGQRTPLTYALRLTPTSWNPNEGGLFFSLLISYYLIIFLLVILAAWLDHIT